MTEQTLYEKQTDGTLKPIEVPPWVAARAQAYRYLIEKGVDPDTIRNWLDAARAI